MKTAIIGLPMVGKTSLFTILTGVTQETRMGSTAVRTGVAKVPDPRVDALSELYQPPKITYATVEYIDAPAISKETLRDPAYLASLRVVGRVRASPPRISGRNGPARTRLRRSHAGFRRRRNGTDPERSGRRREASRPRRQRPQKDQKSGARSKNTNCSSVARKRSKRTPLCAIWSSRRKTKNGFGAFSSFRKNPCFWS